MKKPSAIVLGGTVPHIALLENLKNRGYSTVLIDYFVNPPAKKFAEQHIIASTLDQEKVLELARSINAELVISTCVDQANVTACYVAERMGLPSPYSYEVALSIANKGLMKQKMVDNDIPTSKYLFVNDPNDIKNFDLKYPVVVKPADNYGSTGVDKAFSLSETHHYLNDAIQISRVSQALVEEFNHGIEISVDCIVKNKQVHFLNIREKPYIIYGGKQFMHNSQSIMPAEISEKAIYRTKQIANSIVEVFDLDNTPLLLQAIVEKDNVNIIEFAPRVGGALNFRLVKLSTNYDIIDCAVNSFLNIPIPWAYEIPNGYFSFNHIFANPGFFSHVTGFEDLVKDGIIEEFYILKTKGMEIGSELVSRNHIASFILKADDKQVLNQKLQIAIDRLEVYSTAGNPIMIKDVY